MPLGHCARSGAAPESAESSSAAGCLLIGDDPPRPCTESVSCALSRERDSSGRRVPRADPTAIAASTGASERVLARGTARWCTAGIGGLAFGPPCGWIACGQSGPARRPSDPTSHDRRMRASTRDRTCRRSQRGWNGVLYVRCRGLRVCSLSVVDVNRNDARLGSMLLRTGSPVGACPWECAQWL
jgi:hypothetical protein